MAKFKRGKSSFLFTSKPVIISWASIAVKKESEGPLGSCFDKTSSDTFFGQKTWEQAEKKMQELGSGILEGRAERLPYERKNQTACDYCIFRSVCGFDQKDKNMKFRRLEELSADEVLKKIEEEMK